MNENKVINFPTNNPLSVPTNGTVKTIKDFRKKLKEYDLSKLTYSSVLRVHKPEDCNPKKNPDDLNKPIKNTYFNIKFNKRTKTEELSLGLKDVSSEYRSSYYDGFIDKTLKEKGIEMHRYQIGSRVQFWEIKGGLLEGRINPEFKPYSTSRNYWSPCFTNTLLVTYDDEIVLVCYNRNEPKIPLLRNFIRETIDVNISNNLETIYTKRTFKVPVKTVTYEIAEVSALTYRDARKMIEDSLPQKLRIDEIMKPLDEFFPDSERTYWNSPTYPDSYVRGDYNSKQTVRDNNWRDDEISEDEIKQMSRSFDDYCDLLKEEVEKKVKEMIVERENKKKTTP